MLSEFEVLDEQGFKRKLREDDIFPLDTDENIVHETYETTDEERAEIAAQWARIDEQENN